MHLNFMYQVTPENQLHCKRLYFKVFEQVQPPGLEGKNESQRLSFCDRINSHHGTQSKFSVVCVCVGVCVDVQRPECTQSNLEERFRNLR